MAAGDRRTQRVFRRWLHLKDTAAYDPAAGTLTFRTPDRRWCAIVGASVPPSYGVAEDAIWGSVSESQRNGYSQAHWGTGAKLRWNLDIAAGTEQTLWFVVAGSSTSPQEAEATLRLVLADPASLLRAKLQERTELLAQTQLDLPDPQLTAALEWAKLNMADLRTTVTDVSIRDVDEGKAYPPPVATLPLLSGIGDGYPDYPRFYGTGSGYIIP
jgi:hypothetical protein